MALVDLLNSIWVPVAFLVACLVYGIYMLITKDPSKVRKKDDNRILKDPEKYSINCGYLFLFMGLGCLVMIGIIELLHMDGVANFLALGWFIVFGIFWKLNDNKYGPI